MPYKLARLAFFTLGLLAPTGVAASAQSWTSWVDRNDDGSSLTDRPVAITSLGDGSAIVFVEEDASAGPTPGVLVRRLDENGNRLWTTRWRSSATHLRIADHDVTAAGRSALLVVEVDATRVLVLSASGGLEWEREIPTVVAGVTFQGTAVGFTPSGEVVVSGVQDDFTIPPGAGRVSGLRLNSSGTQLWRVDFQGVAGWGAVGPDGDLYIVDWGPSYDLVARRYDAAGALLWASPIANTDEYFIRHLEVDSRGGLVLAVARNNPPAQTSNDILRLRPDGTTDWRVAFGGQLSASVMLVTAGDDILASDGFQNRVVRISSSGQVLWSRPASAGYDFSGLLSTDSAGRALLSVSRPEPQTFFAMPHLEVIDPTGVTEFVHDLSALGDPTGVVIETATDPSGNLLVTAVFAREPLSPAYSSFVIKVIRGDEIGSRYCSPNAQNSTGAPGRLRLFGSMDVAANNVVLAVEDLPPQTFTFGITSQTQGLVTQPGGSQGNLCQAGAIGRYVGPGQIQSVQPNGTAWLQLDLDSMPTPTGLAVAMAGQTWNFQAWYRDANPGATSNFTDAVSLMLQ